MGILFDLPNMMLAGQTIPSAIKFVDTDSSSLLDAGLFKVRKLAEEATYIIISHKQVQRNSAS